MSRAIVRVGIGRRIVEIDIERTCFQVIVVIATDNRDRSAYPYSFIRFVQKENLGSPNLSSGGKWFTRKSRAIVRVEIGRRIAETDTERTRLQVTVVTATDKRIVNLAIAIIHGVAFIGSSRTACCNR